MTLILTELSPLGIAMAADSAVTFANPATGLRYALPNNANKLQVIPYLNAGISCWGIGQISAKPTDDWLADFIEANTAISKLGDFANALSEELNKKAPKNADGANHLGFHLAGYEAFGGRHTPSFYHIHDGPSSTLAQRGIEVNPYQFNANHDGPPKVIEEEFAANRYLLTRNGDYNLYAQIFGKLQDFFDLLRLQQGILIPYSHNLNDRADYLVFQIRTVSEIYRLSNLVPGIGGRIDFMTVSQFGVNSLGSKFY